MAYTYNQNDNNNYDLVKDGEYEVRIERIEQKTLPSGKRKLAVAYRIRDDVEQEYQNRWLFEDIWAEREHKEYYNRKRINQLLGTQHLKDGTEFNTIQDVIDELVGSYLIAVVRIERDDYRGEDVNKIKFYKSSKERGQFTDSSVEHKETPTVSVTDGELPF